MDPPRLTAALRRWAGDGPRRAYADEVAAVYRAYRDGLEAAGLADEELFAWRALDALRDARDAWGRTPVFAYGFDDFDRLQLDALDTIANVSRGRRHRLAPVRARTPSVQGGCDAAPGAARAGRARSRSSRRWTMHYAAESRAALHHVERLLFEDEPPARIDPGAAISFHSAGGERAEVELAAARILELLRAGVEPGDVAVVFRDPARYSSLLEQVFGAYGIPYSIDRKLPFGHTALGRGLLALIRSATPAGTADDLLTYLRTPGLLRVPGLADRLEADVRKEGAHRAEQARALWERDHWKLEELDRLAGPRDTAAFVAELEAPARAAVRALRTSAAPPC